MGSKYSHFTEHDRVRIETLARLGWRKADIARTLCVDRSSIGREIRRGTCFPFARYMAHIGQRHYRQGRVRNGLARRRLGHDLSAPAWQPVLNALRAGWSPQQFCGRQRLLNSMLGFGSPAISSISHETIYRAIFDLPHGQERHELTCLLRHSQAGRRHRRRRGSRSSRFTALQNITSVHERDPAALLRTIPGHWEGDLIKGADGKSFIGTLVERSTRLTLLVKLRNATAAEVYRGFLRRLRSVPAALRLSLTYDRGSEMALHQRLSKRLGMPIYFCDAYSPGQRPTNENTNGLLRQYLPRNADLSCFSQQQLDTIEHALNSRPRQVLGYRTPLEAFDRALARA